MKKIAFVLAVILLLSLPLSVQAVTPRAISVYPGIIVNGTTATCTVTAAADHMSEYLEATIKLYRDNIWIASWNAEGYGYINFSKDVSALSGHTYTLAVDLKVDGNTVPRVTATATT